MELSFYWNTVSEISKAYRCHRQKIMKKFNLSSIESDVILFLANNTNYDTATSIVKCRKIAKSHISLCVNSLFEKGIITKVPDENNPKLIHLVLTNKADEIISLGTKEQNIFSENMLHGFSNQEKVSFFEYLKRISNNIETIYDKKEKG